MSGSGSKKKGLTSGKVGQGGIGPGKLIMLGAMGLLSVSSAAAEKSTGLVKSNEAPDDIGVIPKPSKFDFLAQKTSVPAPSQFDVVLSEPFFADGIQFGFGTQMTTPKDQESVSTEEVATVKSAARKKKTKGTKTPTSHPTVNIFAGYAKKVHQIDICSAIRGAYFDETSRRFTKERQAAYLKYCKEHNIATTVLNPNDRKMHQIQQIDFWLLNPATTPVGANRMVSTTVAWSIPGEYTEPAPRGRRRLRS